MNKELTLGSLFDGSGGFPLAAIFCGIKPIWSSEVEPFPIRVTQKNLPQVKHLGDIKNIDGSEIEPVDIISFGSPCQDLSIAGKRDGLKGSKSNLFYEAIRVIKEMRCKTNGKYPRYLLWENVPGAFSSNKGEDFRCVLEEITRIKDSTVKLPRPSRWQSAGEILGDNFSLAWRVLDAKYFGVPQRRRRIFLVADLDGGSSREILFESESLRGHFTQSKKTGQETTGDTSKSARETSNICLNDQGGSRMDVTKGVTATLRAKSNHPPLVFDNHGRDARIKGPVDVAQTVVSLYGTGGNNQPFVLEKPRTFDIRLTSEGTVNVRANIYESDVSRTIDTSGNSPNSNQGGIAIVSSKDELRKGKQSTYSSSKNSHFTSAEKELASTLVATDYKDPPLVNVEDLIVRRLTPTECGRLQGFPDGWCGNLGDDNPSDEEINFWEKVWETHRQLISKNKRPKTRKQIIKWLSQPHSDTAEYKMWGNGVALPCVVYVLTGIAIQLNKD